MNPIEGAARDARAPARLAAFIGDRRWFGGRSGAIRDASLANVIHVKWPNARREYAVARANVVTDDGTFTYQLFLPGGGELAEALDDPDFRRGLADAFVRGARFESGGTSWVVESESRQPLVVPPSTPVRLSTAEQTNSSIVIEDEAILKLYRKLEPGIHPDVEVTRFLTIDRLFVHVPVLLGTIRFEDVGGGITIAGMLQELVPGAVDGWRYALDCSAAYFGADTTHERSVPFAQEANQLGMVTRALHEALSSGEPGSGFDLTPATTDDIRRWVDGTTQAVDRALDALDRAARESNIPDELADEARAVLARRPRYVQWIAKLAEEMGTDCGGNTRTHGDYHLGQVLRSSADQFLVIDFEGEPIRPLSERRARHSPLRDVAGMLRSFSYAAAVGAGRSAGGKDMAHPPRPAATAPSALDARASRWDRATREAFLRGYFDTKDTRQGLLPRSQSNAGRLIALFEAEKLFYELQYELAHRPDWAWIPLRGIARLET